MIGPTDPGKAICPMLDADTLYEGGWWRIGQVDPPVRRSLWVRLTMADGTWFAPESEWGSVTKVELCAGREGDDAYVFITDEPHLQLLAALLLRAIGAAEDAAAGRAA